MTPAALIESDEHCNELDDAESESPSPAHARTSIVSDEPCDDSDESDAEHSGSAYARTAVAMHPRRGSEKAEREILEKRIQHVLEENVSLCAELAEVNVRLRETRASRDDFDVTSKAAATILERQKLVAQSVAKNCQHTARSELQRLTEAAQMVTELGDIERRLQQVNRQVVFATDLQAQTLQENERRILCRSRHIRKLELAMYTVVGAAQCDDRLQPVVAGLVSKAGPLVQSVLAREAKRQVLELRSGT
mmetsp:Transcript_29224/g.80104  ORF Transcript_29224/g.80104 Transcript_29224/m.80104 type:complete len:250 (-) Transcript_29224:74-823(-)|eukprot:CAMPEP_0117569634 /NCGR_PEP_ID=MMETSP0784-20121206/58763_1 /TAXON_ID=39447 /ORGANISM="" /LENGTH=249 /DNA_ID=CAMNT_0005367621 /DNA_START=79 /DNA_END=828 /DNA_ORIENTATION=-